MPLLGRLICRLCGGKKAHTRTGIGVCPRYDTCNTNTETGCSAIWPDDYYAILHDDES